MRPALGNSSLHAGLLIQRLRLIPKVFRLFRVASVAHQQGVAPDRIRQFKCRRLFVPAIKRKSLFVALCCLRRLSLFPVDVGNVANRMRQPPSIAFLAQQLNRLAKMLQRAMRLTLVPFNLSQSGQCLRQQQLVVRLAAVLHCRGKQVPRIGQPFLSSCLKAARDQLGRRGRHHCERVARAKKVRRRCSCQGAWGLSN